ncbi:glutathione S-transferase TCHQD [Cryptomeria japonica]|uniref:glutathione S-transferase TCHQD n=1 Tax=Cryptomeria japonica TaxID=3369 RepID=UPI0027DA739F|nr:glutathione S-transferase TCHQD [Cryptomeria japonica]XP_057861662.2 glutathione S-transferase TCHQD [Cryptomeria japonica]XP_057861663.2 glutathione S-transferase TCHQD [Cryptomeria japonica]
MVSGDVVNYSKEMHLYHHPFSLDSQKVRLALEEKSIDYVSHKMNPLKGRNLDLDFFRMNPTGKIPVFKNGDIIIFDTLTIVEYIDGINEPLGGNDVDHRRMLAWMQKIDEWNPKLFTLSNIPQKYILFFSRFKRQVAIARMSQSPDLADKYHLKLRGAYATEEQLKDEDAVNESTEKLAILLDDAETQLAESKFLAGEKFSMADAMFVPILARIELLNKENEYIGIRTHLLDYWNRVKERPSYGAVIGKYFSGWRKYKSLLSTYTSVWIRNVFKRY